MEKHLPNFKYVMHWKKYLFFSAGNSASGLAFSSVYVCVSEAEVPSCFRRAARPWMAELASSTTPWKAGDSPAAQQDEVQLVEDHAAVIYCNFQGVSFSATCLEQPLQRLSKFLYTTPSVFSTQGLVLSSKFRVWFANFWKMHKILWLLRLHWILVLLKNLLSKSWVKVSYLFLNVFENAKGRHWKFSNSFSSL